MEAEVHPLKMIENLICLVDRHWQNTNESSQAGRLVAWCRLMSFRASEGNGYFGSLSRKLCRLLGV